MTMNRVTHVADRSHVASVTDSFLDAAAALETSLHDADLHIQKLQRELRHAQQQQQRAQQWIVALRRSHRRTSHAKTSKLFKTALIDLALLNTMAQVAIKSATGI